MSYSFDASSVIHLWDNYPIRNDHFKSLWDSFTEKFQNGIFTISDVALREVTSKIPDFEEKIGRISPEGKNINDLHQILIIKNELGIQEENYRGVGENDLFIIAIAKRNGHILVSEEAIQQNLPTDKRRYKIPLVCQNIAKIKCINIKMLLDKEIL